MSPLDAFAFALSLSSYTHNNNNVSKAEYKNGHIK